MAESQRAFHLKELRPPSSTRERSSCGAISSAAGAEVLPLGLSDEDAIARAYTLASKRKSPFDGFEVWNCARFVFRRAPADRREPLRTGGS